MVYEEDGIDGHFAPLSFSADSICISDMGDEALCAPDAFRNAVQVTVKGEMSEIGVDVKRIEF